MLLLLSLLQHPRLLGTLQLLVQLSMRFDLGCRS